MSWCVCGAGGNPKSWEAAQSETETPSTKSPRPSDDLGEPTQERQAASECLSQQAKQNKTKQVSKQKSGGDCYILNCLPQSDF